MDTSRPINTHVGSTIQPQPPQPPKGAQRRRRAGGRHGQRLQLRPRLLRVLRQPGKQAFVCNRRRPTHPSTHPTPDRSMAVGPPHRSHQLTPNDQPQHQPRTPTATGAGDAAGEPNPRGDDDHQRLRRQLPRAGLFVCVLHVKGCGMVIYGAGAHHHGLMEASLPPYNIHVAIHPLIQQPNNPTTDYDDRRSPSAGSSSAASTASRGPRACAPAAS